jgi:outer membrane protein assembly factor BamB
MRKRATQSRAETSLGVLVAPKLDAYMGRSSGYVTLLGGAQSDRAKSLLMSSAPCRSFSRVLHGVVQFAAALAIGPVGANLSNVPLPMPVPNGAVNAIVRIGDRAYIGGSFSRIGPRSGSGVVLDARSGARDARWPTVAGGDVSAAIPDGYGGWYIAGEFSHVGRIRRDGLAHVRSDRSVDRQWKPGIDGSAVDAIAVSPRHIFVGSSLASFDAKGTFLLALDRETGRRSPRFAAARPVGALAVAGSTLYVATGSVIGAYDTSSGRLLWRVRLKINPCREHGHGDCVATPQVRALAVSGTSLFIGGFFNQVNGTHRRDAAAVDRVSARPSAWSPQPNGPIDALTVAGAAVYVGGEFTHIGGARRTHLAELDTGDGRALPWTPRESAAIEALVVGTRAVYVVRRALRPEAYLAAYDRATGKRLSWRPAPNDYVHALAVARNRVLVGGSFTGLRSAERRGLAVVNVRTRALEAWNPKLVGSIDPQQPDVNALETDGQRLYVGGAFVRAGGEKRNNLAAFDLRSGTLTPWNPDADGDVNALIVDRSTVLAGGSFQNVGGAEHDGIVKLDDSGRVMPFAADIGGVSAWARSGRTLYVAGRCDAPKGIERNEACAIDATTGALLPWNPDADSVVWTLAVSDSAVYAGGVFNEIGRRSRTAFGALDPVTGDGLEWDLHAQGNAILGPGASALVSSLVVRGSQLYVGGDFDALAGIPRHDLAAFDLGTRTPIAWAPVPTGPPYDQAIGAIVPADDGVLVGGTFFAIGGRPQAHLAFFPGTATR